jgi:hypothetical protein
MFQQQFGKVCFVYFFAVFVIGCQATRQLTPTAEYIRRPIQGWTVYIHPGALANNKDVGPALELLDGKLKGIAGSLPNSQVAKLQAFAFWIDETCDINAPITTHYSKDWLHVHGHNPDMAMGIEICQPDRFRWQAEDDSMLVLRTLAWAYHAKYLRSDNGLLDAYDTAMASGNYESVRNLDGKRVRAFATVSPSDYFAELTNAYWGRNNLYPFTRNDLREFDPKGYALMERVWLGAK